MILEPNNAQRKQLTQITGTVAIVTFLAPQNPLPLSHIWQPHSGQLNKWAVSDSARQALIIFWRANRYPLGSLEKIIVPKLVIRDA